MHIEARTDAQERYNEQLEVLKHVKHYLFEASLYLEILDRKMKNRGCYVNIDDVEMRSMRTTLELFKHITQRGIED